MVDNTCLNHLHICKAECCKVFTLTLKKRMHIQSGTILSWDEEDKDLLYYYDLHNVTIEDNKCSIVAKNYRQVGTKVYIYGDCKGLTSDNLCKYHNTDKKPKICGYPNKDTESSKVLYTNNCVYKRYSIRN